MKEMSINEDWVKMLPQFLELEKTLSDKFVGKLYRIRTGDDAIALRKFEILSFQTWTLVGPDGLLRFREQIKTNSDILNCNERIRTLQIRVVYQDTDRDHFALYNKFWEANNLNPDGTPSNATLLHPEKPLN